MILGALLFFAAFPIRNKEKARFLFKQKGQFYDMIKKSYLEVG